MKSKYLCPGWWLVVKFLSDPLVSLLILMCCCISSSSCLSSVTLHFKDCWSPAQDIYLPSDGEVVLFCHFSLQSNVLQLHCNSGTPRQTITAAAGALHPKHICDQIEGLSNTNSSISSGITLTFLLKQFSLQYPSSETAPRCLSLGCRFGSGAKFHKNAPGDFLQSLEILEGFF